MAYAPLYERLYGLSCAGGDRSGCVGRCEHEAGVYFGEKHDRCPVAEANDDMRLKTVNLLRSQASLNPLSGYPETFVAWVTTLWGEVVAQEAEMREEHVHG